jgi:two-component system nitrogen regulation response regulator NtrX
VSETVLIVDDEESIRRTFSEWLAESGLDCVVLLARNEREALEAAAAHTIDLALLDWHLGAGVHGLQLLASLVEFNPDLTAVLITGYADKATPLEALRMGVRDYLDKNQNLTRDVFVRVVREQLRRIGPIKERRLLTDKLYAFREAVEKSLPLIDGASQLTDPVPLPEAAQALVRFVARVLGARDGVVVVHAADGPGVGYAVYALDGARLAEPLVPFARTLAASASSMRHPLTLELGGAEPLATDGFALQPFEQGRQSALLVPLAVGMGVQVVVELFDKPGGFSEADRPLASAAAELGTEMLRQALAHRHHSHLLAETLRAALQASDTLSRSLVGSDHQRATQPPPESILQSLRAGLTANTDSVFAGESAHTVELLEAVRALTVRYGDAGVRHCVRVVQSAMALLDEITGANS